MANETTLSSWSAAKRVSLTAILNAIPLPANVARYTLTGLLNQDSIAGQPSKTKGYAVDSDSTIASALTEGSSFTTNVEHTFGTAVDATPTEFGLRAVITDQALERMVPGYLNVDPMDIPAMINMADPLVVADALAPVVARHTNGIKEKIEFDANALLESISSSVGTTTVNLAVADLFDAQYTLNIAEPTSMNKVTALTERQIQDIRTEVAATSGGLGGGVWSGPMDASLINDGVRTNEGSVASFGGHPVFAISNSVKDTANGGADDVGVHMVRGVGSTDGGNLDLSPIVIVHGRDEITRYVAFDIDLRAVVMLSVALVKVIEVKDANGVAIISDA